MDGWGVPDTTIYIFILIVVLAGAATVQFFKGRKKNLAMLEKSIRILEKVFKPQDKNYTIIGLYVGYSAIYRLKDPAIKAVETVVLLFPRQSLLYAPIAKLTSRYDKAYIIVHYAWKRFPGEAHLVAKGYYRLGIKRAIKGIEKMKIEKIMIGNKQYYLVYTDRRLAEKLLNYAKNLENPHLVQHMAIVPKSKRLYMAIRLDIDRFKEMVQKYYELAKSL